MECLARSTLSKGPVIIYVEGGGGEGHTCWKDQNFCKAPPADHVNSKWPPILFNIYVMTPPHTHTPPPHISSYMLFKVIIKMHVTY